MIEAYIMSQTRPGRAPERLPSPPQPHFACGKDNCWRKVKMTLEGFVSFVCGKVGIWRKGVSHASRFWHLPPRPVRVVKMTLCVVKMTWRVVKITFCV